MGRILSFLFALTLAAPAVLSSAGGHASNRSQPMHFTLYRQGSPDTCSNKCKLIISAFGDITADTPQEFEKFARGKDLTAAIVVLDSDGGSVHGALTLGREIRGLGLDTTVGRIVDVTNISGISYGTISPRADCESMCAFVLLAGVHRLVPDEARVMVHQIWLGDRREDPAAANYSAEDLVLVQQDIGRLAQYTPEMGVSIEMLDLSLRIPPWEPMHAMSPDELHRMRVTNDEFDNRILKISAGAPMETATVQSVSDEARVTEISERHWAIIDHLGTAALARRHPLTIEGREIGHFDLLFSCGSMKGDYNVNYIEHRHKRNDMLMPNVLRTISLRFGSRETALKIMSSTRQDNSDELVTMASGPLPGTILDRFTAEGSHSLTIETESEGLTTSIRIGNTGVQQNMTQLASVCAKPLTTHAELSVAKTGSIASAK